MELGRVVRVVGGLRYDTETATVLAAGEPCDARRGLRMVWLLRTPRGRYFTITRLMWPAGPDGADVLEPVATERAVELYYFLPNKLVDYEVAFPDLRLDEA